jgi:hypothetical protein
MKKCTEWTEEQAIPALYASGGFCDNDIVFRKCLDEESSHPLFNKLKMHWDIHSVLDLHGTDWFLNKEKEKGRKCQNGRA